MPEALPSCPTCHFDAVVKNGRTRHNKQNYKCRDCGRQFVEAPLRASRARRTPCHH